MTGAAVLDLVEGAAVAFDGVNWSVECVEPQFGRVRLVGSAGESTQKSFRWLVNHPTLRVVQPIVRPEPDFGVGQPVRLEDLEPEEQDRVRTRVAHVLEAETGYRSGTPHVALPGEPRPAYDPATTTLGQRRRSKAAELAAMDRDEARMLGLAHMGLSTLNHLGPLSRTSALVTACIDRRHLPRRRGHPSVTEDLKKAIFAVRAETLHRSRISMATRVRLIHQYMAKHHGDEVELPHYTTLAKVWKEWFGPGGSRPKYDRSEAAVDPSGTHVVIHRPGQVVALDTTVLPVKVRETVFGEAVSVHLTLAMDLFTHSLVAFRLTLVSDTSTDVAMVLRDMTMPLPMREGWGDDMEWPYPGVPAQVVAQFAGHKVAALPFFAPETVTTDHGAVYRNHHLVEVQRVLGCNILPARVLRPQDKHAVERAFAAVQSLLFEFLLGYQGVDVADRGSDPEADAVLSVDQMEHLLATWIVKIWQNRQLGEHAPCWDAGGTHSPNSLFAASMRQGGFSLHIPKPELYYKLLPAHYVKIHKRRGVKLGGLWYDGPALEPYRGQLSARSGRHAGRWVIHRDKRDCRFAFFQDPVSLDWHVLRWNGLPPEGEVPAFSDARAQDLLAEVRRIGLRPRSDAELLPVLLQLLSQYIPVSAWPTQSELTKQQRIQLAREAAQGQAAAADRPRADVAQPAPLALAAAPASTHHELIDAERRRRREASVDKRPLPPPRLGDGYRKRNIFALPDPDQDRNDTSTAPAEDGC